MLKFLILLLSIFELSFSKPILQGSFFQPDLPVKWGPEGFAKEFDIMKTLKMTHVIWQWTVDSKNKIAWYPTSLQGYKQNIAYDALAVSLQEAQRTGIKVWIGLNDNSDWWKNYAHDGAWLHQEFEIGKQIVSDTWNKYSEKYKDSIAGYYIVFEMDNVNFFDEKSKQNMAKEYKNICDHIHSLTKKPVMVAPFFNMYYIGNKMNEVQYARLWHDILLVADVGNFGYARWTWCCTC